MLPLQRKFPLSCLCSKVRGEPWPIVARLPGMGGEEVQDGWEAGEERDKF